MIEIHGGGGVITTIIIHWAVIMDRSLSQGAHEIDQWSIEQDSNASVQSTFKKKKSTGIYLTIRAYIRSFFFFCHCQKTSKWSIWGKEKGWVTCYYSQCYFLYWCLMLQAIRPYFYCLRPFLNLWCVTEPLCCTFEHLSERFVKSCVV